MSDQQSDKKAIPGINSICLCFRLINSIEPEILNYYFFCSVLYRVLLIFHRPDESGLVYSNK